MTPSDDSEQLNNALLLAMRATGKQMAAGILAGGDEGTLAIVCQGEGPEPQGLMDFAKTKQGREILIEARGAMGKMRELLDSILKESAPPGN